MPHIIVTGELDYESVNRFLGEYFHPDHVNKLGFSRLADIVLVSKLPPSSEMESLMNRRQYGSGTKIRYVQASITTRSGMAICDADSAGACIVLSKKICPSFTRTKATYHSSDSGAPSFEGHNDCSPTRYLWGAVVTTRDTAPQASAIMKAETKKNNLGEGLNPGSSCCCL